MHYQIIHDNWLSVDDPRYGVTFIPMSDLFAITSEIPDIKDIQPYIEYPLHGDVDFCIQSGYGFRLHVPGCLDSTEWTGVFETALIAARHLYELYGSDFEEHEDDWEIQLRNDFPNLHEH